MRKSAFSRIAVIATCLAAASLSTAAMAQNAIYGANNQLRVSAGTQTSFDYKKKDADGLTSGEKDGSQNGISVTYTSQQDLGGISNFYLSASVNYLKGDTKYNGWELLPGNTAWTPATGKTDYKSLDYDLKLGKGFQLDGGRAQVTPYVNIGTRNWTRDSLAYGGYKEKHSNSFYGVGTMFQYALTADLVVSADAMFAKNTNSEVDWVSGGETYNMKNKGTTQLGFGVNYRLTETLSVFADYRIAKTKFGAGDRYQGYVEPANTAKTQRLNVGVAMNF